MKILKLLIFVSILCFGLSSCSKDNSNNDNSEQSESNAWKGFETYEGTWAPVAYQLKGEWHECDPNNPGISNIDRLTFIKYKGNEVILRDEYYSSKTGEWEQRSDSPLWWKDGSFYEDENCSASKKCTDIYVTTDGYLHLCSKHSTYVSSLKLKKNK